MEVVYVLESETSKGPDDIISKKTSIACEKLGSRMAGPGQCHPGSSLNVSLCCCFACFARGRGPDLDFPPSAASSVASHPSRWSR